MRTGDRTVSDQQAAEVLRWICDVFSRAQAKYQTVGGLAARAYGATRPLNDLDFYVRAEDLPRVLDYVGDSLVWGPEHFKDASWDLTFAKVERHGVQIEIAEAEGARYFSPCVGRWLDQNIDFQDSQHRIVLGVDLEVMSKDRLISYKRALNRPVDRMDLHEMTG